MKKKKNKILTLIIFLILLIFGYNKIDIEKILNGNNTLIDHSSYTLEDVNEYSGQAYIIINNNEPNFDDNYKINKSFEEYSALDKLGRAGTSFANIGIDLMPDNPRTSIGQIKPSGWQTVKYDNIDGKYLYNRCHLIAYQLTGENANEKNLITCTRQMNNTTMKYFENKVADYIKNTKNHVLYRVTPIYDNDNLLATGVQMEAYSVEDNGLGIKFNIFVYNVQEGIEINYKNGESKLK